MQTFKRFDQDLPDFVKQRWPIYHKHFLSVHPDLLGLKIEFNLQQNFGGCTKFGMQLHILMHQLHQLHCTYLDASCRHFPPEWISITLNRRFPELSKSLHPCNIGVKTGPDRKLERSAQNSIFRRFLRKMATFPYFSSEMHWSELFGNDGRNRPVWLLKKPPKSQCFDLYTQYCSYQLFSFKILCHSLEVI